MNQEEARVGDDDEKMPFDRLQALLETMQLELALRQWADRPLERCHRAANLRHALWDAICAYRDNPRIF